MGSLAPAPESEAARAHAVMIPYPAQGHVTPMLQLAKLLHARGFHVTFVNNEFNHRRHLRARGPRALDGAPGFRFATIDDGLPPSDVDATQDVPALCRSTMTTCLPRFKDLVARLDAEGGSSPRVTCVVADSTMTFALRAARELGLRCATLWTASACGFLGYYHYRHLVDRGLVPLKDEAHLLDGHHLDATAVDWVPGAPAGGPLRLRDFPSFVRTTDPDDVMLNFFIHETAGMAQASAVVVNTFDELDAPQLRAMARLLGLPVLTVGPLPLTVRNNVPHDSPVAGIASNLWKEDQDAPLRWLHGRAPRSVVYVNFGSITVMSGAQLAEFAWGLANTGYDFLWNVRPDLANGAGGLPPEFLAAVEGRALLTTWCPQEAVLAHEAVGVFLTHSGWNSTLESICGGVPMVCWPFFAEQQTNCRYKCTEWGIGMEVPDEVRRGEVEKLIREAMEGEKGREMRQRVTELRDSAVAATSPGGRSMRNVDRLIEEVLLAS